MDLYCSLEKVHGQTLGRDIIHIDIEYSLDLETRILTLGLRNKGTTYHICFG